MKTIILLVILFNIQDIHCGVDPGIEIVIDNPTKAAILAQHNGIRSSVEGGAANMKKLSWDDELAERCRLTAIYCPGQYGSSREVAVPKENVIWSFDEEEVSEDLTEYAVEEWYAQESLYKENQCEGNLNQTYCQEYLRVVWAENDKIGCSAATCKWYDEDSEEYTNETIICCAYGSVQVSNQSQYQDPKNVFIPGKPCSRCDDNYGCENNLCVPFDGNTTAATTKVGMTTTSLEQKKGESATTISTSSTTSASSKQSVGKIVIHCSVFVGFILNIKIATYY